MICLIKIICWPISYAPKLCSKQSALLANKHAPELDRIAKAQHPSSSIGGTGTQNDAQDN